MRATPLLHYRFGMSTLRNFHQYAGKQVRVTDPQAMGPLFMRVLAKGEIDDEAMEEFLGDLHPDGALEDGYQVIAIEGDIEEGEIDAGGFIAVNADEDRAYLCDSGTIRFLEGAASEIEVEAEEEDEDES